MTPRSFLQPGVGAELGRFLLRNARTGAVVAWQCEIAGDSASRNRGLIGRTGLATNAVMAIAPCNAIHMFFMKFAIDVVFADRSGRIVKTRAHLRPWRIAFARGAYCALEFAEGAIERHGMAVGDELVLEEGSPPC